MKIKISLVLLLMTVVTAFSIRGAFAKEPGDWITLFNGHSLQGWIPEESAKWHVASGAIISDAGGDGFLLSSRKFSNFILKIEYRNSPMGNSGVFLRAPKESDPSDHSDPAGGYELNINNENDKWPTGSIENFIPRLITVDPVPNQWHSYVVVVRGDHITVRLDGAKIVDGKDSKFTSGFIALQHHAGNKIEFRHISIKELAN